MTNTMVNEHPQPKHFELLLTSSSQYDLTVITFQSKDRRTKDPNT